MGLRDNSVRPYTYGILDKVGGWSDDSRYDVVVAGAAALGFPESTVSYVGTSRYQITNDTQ